MTEQEWKDLTDEEKFNAYNRAEEQLLSLSEQISDLRQKLYLLRKILKWKGNLAEDKGEG